MPKPVFGKWKLLGWFGELEMMFTGSAPFVTSSRLRFCPTSIATPSATPSMLPSVNDKGVDSASSEMLVSFVILEKYSAIDFVPLVRLVLFSPDIIVIQLNLG